MISLSAGRWRPSFAWARGTSTARLSWARTRRSSSALWPSRLARRARISISSRASWIAAVCRAYTSQVTARNATSHTATQWRPLTLMRHLERAQQRGAGAWIRAHLGGPRPHRALRQHPAERTSPAGAHRLARRADAPPAPLAECVLDDAILTRMVRDDGHAAAGDERRPQRRQPQVELLELLIHDDAERLKQAREVRRPRARAQRLADRVHQVVARDERRVAPPLHDHLREPLRPPLVGELRERLRQPLDRPGVHQVRRRQAPPSGHPHV